MGVRTTPDERARSCVTLTVDGVEVSVPKGTGLVEAALAAGIEIPVFCYEPRLGPPVGACRMCLCEVAPGPPKPQAACTLTAAEGMAVKTAQTSEMAAEAQNATLEFILVNHPLDCPVCDKGGECPLQDLTFRYGPGNTRMHFPKRTFEKPIPISPDDRARPRALHPLLPLHPLLGDRSPRTGSSWRVERGSQSMIATFEDEPYRAPFSGNVIELCPVGALTSTQYRFEARPWEIQNVPTVCGLCPVGCNISATTREGKVKRILSRNHPEVDEGWLCDKGRFAFSHLDADDRIEDPLRKAGVRRFEPIGWDEAVDEAERHLRAAGSAIVTALSGTETVEQAYGLAKLLRVGLGAHAAVLPEAVPDALDHFRAPLSSIRDAAVVVVLCDEPVVERAPVVDLWIKAARRAGARVLTELPEEKVEGAVLITDDAEHAAWFARDLDADRGLLPARDTERPRCGRRLERRRRRRAGRRRAEAADRLGRQRRRRPGRAGDGRAGRHRDRDRPVRGLLPRLLRPRPPWHELPGARRHRPSTSRAGSSASVAR